MHKISYEKYACIPKKTRGRLYKQGPDKHRTAFQRDKDRIIHSACFRRMQYKTQVFVNHEGDHYRTRLTHSLEVAQIAHSISRSLGICADLAECLALAHDVGHPPFGHAGEEALNLVMKPYGGFDHNAHSLKLLTELEHRYADFNGLNLTWETLEGIAKHNGPVTSKNKALKPIYDYSKKHDLSLKEHSSMEAQVASLADDIAYNNHDIEDGIRAGLITIEDLSEIPELRDFIKDVKLLYPKIEMQRLVHEVIRRMVNAMVSDLVDQTKSNIKKFKIETVDDVRGLGKPVVDFSQKILDHNTMIRKLLKENVYLHFKVNRMRNKAKRVVRELFHLFMDDIDCLPPEWRIRITDPKSKNESAAVVSDFIAGMTDRFALKEYKSFFDLSQNRSEI